MTFEEAAGGAIAELVHVAVPQHDRKGVRDGWPKCYGKPHGKNISAQKRKNSRSLLAPADELDDLVAVARLHRRFGPCGARQYFEVSFDGYAAGVQAERDQQIGNHRAGLGFALFSVYNNRNYCFHGHVEFLRQPAHFPTP